MESGPHFYPSLYEKLGDIPDNGFRVVRFKVVRLSLDAAFEALEPDRPSVVIAF
jgi:hypothetical protein